MSTGYRTAGKRLAPLVLAAGAAGFAITPQAHASLTISLQLAGSTAGAPITSAPIVGTTPIEVDVWAQVVPNLAAGSYTGTNPITASTYYGQGGASAYAFTFAYYGLVSTQVSPGGDVATSGGLTSAALESWDKGSGASPGVLGDTNADGAADDGSSPESALDNNVAFAVGNTSNSPYPYGVTASDVQPTDPGGIPATDVMPLPGGGYEFLLQRDYFTPSATDATTLGRKISYAVSIPTGSTSALWIEDGDAARPGKITINGNSNTSDPNNYLVGSSVLFYVPGVTPEPASVSLLGLTAVGLLARRRKA